MHLATALSIVAVLISLAGVAFAGWQLWLQRLQQKLDLGAFYVQRFWAIDDDLLIHVKDSPEHNRHRHRYLRLFEDEFDAAKIDALAPKQWSQWHSTLDANKQAETVRADLVACDPDEQAFHSIRACLNQREQSDYKLHGIKECAARVVADRWVDIS